MRVEKISFENLNSLAGKFQIDFNHPSYLDNGIFAIIGKTGAGKTTILDAISLALYGSTPRYTTISANQGEIMSKHTDVCGAEVVFSNEGQFWKSNWSQKRDKHGKPTSAKMSLNRVDKTGKDIKEEDDNHFRGIKAVKEKNSELTGLSWENFSKSVLLAQGKFTAFLKANDTQKSAILEQITQTEVYRALSKYAATKSKSESRALEILEQSLSEFELLDKDVLRELEDKHKQIEKDLSGLEEQIKVIEKNLSIIEDKEKLADKKDYFQNKFDKLTVGLEGHEEDKKLLSLAMKALKVNPIFTKKQELSDSLDDNNSQLEKIEESLKGLEEKIAPLVKKREESKIELETLESEEDETRQLFKQVNELENNINQQNKYLEDSQKNLESLQKKIKKVDKEIAVLSSDKEAKEKNIASLKEELGGKTVEQYREELYKLKSDKENQDLVERFDEFRNKLANGDQDQCFLCGSTDHPYLEEAPDFDSHIEADIKRISELLDRVEDGITSSKNKIEVIDSKVDSKSDVMSSYQEDKEALVLKTVEYANQIEVLASKRNDLFGDKDIEVEEKTFNESLKKARSKNRRIIKEIEKSTAEINTKTGSKEELEKQVESNKSNLQKAEHEYADKLREVGFVEKEFLEYILPEKEIDKLQEKIEIFDREYRDLSNQISTYAEQIEAKEKEQSVTDSKDDLKERLQQHNEKRKRLSEEKTIINVKIEGDKRDRARAESKKKEFLAQKEKANRWKKLDSLIGPAGSDPLPKFAQALTFDSLVGLANLHLKKISDRYILSRNLFSVDEDNDGVDSKGDSDVDSKNKDDEKSSSTLKNPLDLFVLDSYQNNASRNVDSLSGGESFIVSLSLALGLSDIVSKKITIKSLFLDEGFGTLDEETLEDALDVLEKVASRDKLVGLISHVPAVRERIPTLIEVESIGGGRSTISGPGCSHTMK